MKTLPSYHEFSKKLGEDGLDVNAADSDGNTTLHLIAANHKFNHTVVEDLLKAGADPNLCGRKNTYLAKYYFPTLNTYYDPVTPFQLAIFYNNDALVKLYIKYGHLKPYHIQFASQFNRKYISLFLSSAYITYCLAYVELIQMALDYNDTSLFQLLIINLPRESYNIRKSVQIGGVSTTFSYSDAEFKRGINCTISTEFEQSELKIRDKLEEGGFQPHEIASVIAKIPPHGQFRDKIVHALQKDLSTNKLSDLKALMKLDKETYQAIKAMKQINKALCEGYKFNGLPMEITLKIFHSWFKLSERLLQTILDFKSESNYLPTQTQLFYSYCGVELSSSQKNIVFRGIS